MGLKYIINLMSKCQGPCLPHCYSKIKIYVFLLLMVIIILSVHLYEIRKVSNARKSNLN